MQTGRCAGGGAAASLSEQAYAGVDPLAGTDWPEHVPELAAEGHLRVLAAVEMLRAHGHAVYPAQRDVFRALQTTPWHGVRVVILGQDPYHGPGQAHGLAFSVPDGVALPRSLRNIFKEVEADCGGSEAAGHALPRSGTVGGALAESGTPGLLAPFRQASGDLTRWARQGVLLLNTVLTVEQGRPNSHAGMGWETVTRAVLAALGARPEPCAFLLWGRPAHAFSGLVSNPAHLVLTAAHPSPLSASRGFFGCGHFSRVNEWLAAQGYPPIAWRIPEARRA